MGVRSAAPGRRAAHRGPAAPLTDREVRARLLSATPKSRPAGLLVLTGVTLAAVGVVGQCLALAALLSETFATGRIGLSAAGWVAVAVAVRPLGGWLQARAAQWAASDAKYRLRQALLDAAARREAYRPGQRSTGEYSTLVTRGLDALDPYLVGYLPQLLAAALVPLAVLVAMLRADPISGVLLLITLPLIPVFGALVGLHTRDATARQWEALARLGGHFLDTLRGLSTLRVFGRAGAQEAIVAEVADAHRRATLRTLRIAFLNTLVLDTVATLSVALIAVPVGLRLLGGSLTLHTALVVLLLAPEAYLPLRALGLRFHAATEGLTTAREALTLTAPDADSDQGPRGGRSHPGSANTIVSAPGAPSNAGAPTIEFERVGLWLPGRPAPVLEEVSFRIEPGERLALTGPSGGGKSTLLALLLGFARPDTGRILIDGTDLARLDAEAWLRRLAWVPQRPHLFDRSVADNIRLGAPGAEPARVAAAARAAAADEFVRGLPEGYATRLGPRGAGLSAGQRQRIALARAFLRDAPLLLLDEPTAGLDSTSEDAVLDASERLMAGRTVLLVAHRERLLDGIDRRLEVHDGQVRERQPS
ncbi:thiol reductant ABC exporter subunit CydD [Streptomyces sp. NPDC006879]|uniref:thiol reductant ABC exporter subunit CydD n=1 Tax=Streptomyces sp. NPDC006879 TaxID=3364767 RepID=UPI0036BAFDA8